MDKPHLTSNERDRLERLKRRSRYLGQKIAERDPKVTRKLMEKFGDKYNDFHTAEKSAIDWAIKFIENNSY
jgi:translation initiation factor 2 alpha subunit (eIF-2alpha)